MIEDAHIVVLERHHEHKDKGGHSCDAKGDKKARKGQRGHIGRALWGAKGEKDMELGRAKREASTLTTGSELKSDADMRGDRERGNRGTTSKGHAARENSDEK